MSLSSFAHWLERREWAMDFAASSHAYPIVLAIHLSCIALFGGMILLTNFRLLGWALTDYPVRDLVERLRVWKTTGFVIMAGCGLLLAGSEAGKYYANTYFWVKMSLLALVGLHALVFRRGVYRSRAAPDDSASTFPQAKVAAISSLILWTCIVCAGRLIGYHVLN
jgi:uncharacterized membrane protein